MSAEAYSKVFDLFIVAAFAVPLVILVIVGFTKAKD